MKATFIMKTCIPLFLLLAVNGAWATFPLPYIQLGLLPPPHNFIHQPAQRFGVQSQFLIYPQFRQDFLNIYQPLSYAQPPRYNYYEYSQAPRYPLYSEYFPAPENAHNRVVQYVYHQTPLHPSSSSFEEPMKNLEPGLQVFNRVAEDQKPEIDSKQTEELTTNPVNSLDSLKSEDPTNLSDKSTSEEATINLINSIDSSKSEEATMNPVDFSDNSNSKDGITNPKNLSDNSKSQEVTINPINTTDNSQSEEVTDKPRISELMNSTQQEEAEDITAQSTEDHESDAILPIEKTSIESIATA